jgi:hypothetical protein
MNAASQQLVGATTTIKAVVAVPSLVMLSMIEVILDTTTRAVALIDLSAAA